MLFIAAFVKRVGSLFATIQGRLAPLTTAEPISPAVAQAPGKETISVPGATVTVDVNPGFDNEITETQGGCNHPELLPEKSSHEAAICVQAPVPVDLEPEPDTDVGSANFDSDAEGGDSEDQCDMSPILTQGT